MYAYLFGEGLRTKVIDVRSDTLVDVIDMSIRFDEDFTHNQNIHRKHGLMVPPTKFKKIISDFKGSKKHSINCLER